MCDSSARAILEVTTEAAELPMAFKNFRRPGFISYRSPKSDCDMLHVSVQRFGCAGFGPQMRLSFLAAAVSSSRNFGWARPISAWARSVEDRPLSFADPNSVTT